MATVEGNFDLFGIWGKENAPADASAPPKAKPKGKSSRFTSLFASTEEPPKAPQDVAPTPPPPGHSANGSKDEDKEGFQRILQMLGSSNISGAQSGLPGIPAPVNDARQGGIALDFQAPPPEQSPETLVSRQSGSRAFEERTLLESFLTPGRPSGLESRPSHGMFSPISPDPEPGSEQFRAPRPDSNRPAEDFPIQRPPSRNSSAQGMLNLQSILNNRANREPNRENKQSEREFLLALMRDSGTPPQMAGQNMPRPPENHNLPPFYDAQKAAMHQQKGRPIQPGYIEEQRMLAQNELMRREAEQREASLREASFRDIREMREREAAMQQSEHLRKPNPRFAPGFEDPAIIGLQRRATGDLPRQMTNMGIPSQPVPDLAYMRDPRMAQTPQDRPIAPPPGFGPAGMRQPPGFGGPQQPMGPLSAGNTPYGHPAMGPQGMGGMFPNQGRNQMAPPVPPQGYFPPPPGFPGPPMGMGARGDDPRMMIGRPEFDPQFGGPNQPGMNRPGGRPPNMYNNMQ
jgi:hypothetical protein